MIRFKVPRPVRFNQSMLAAVISPGIIVSESVVANCWLILSNQSSTFETVVRSRGSDISLFHLRVPVRVLHLDFDCAFAVAAWTLACLSHAEEYRTCED